MDGEAQPQGARYAVAYEGRREAEATSARHSPNSVEYKGLLHTETYNCKAECSDFSSINKDDRAHEQTRELTYELIRNALMIKPVLIHLAR